MGVAVTKAYAVSLSTAAALTLAVTVFGYLPATIYSGSAADFSWPLGQMLTAYLLPAVGTVVAITLVAAILPRRLAAGWAALVAVLAVVVWAHAAIPVVSMSLLDGQNWTTGVTAQEATIDLIFILATVAVTLFVLLKWTPAAFRLILGLAAVLLVQTAVFVIGDDKEAVAATPVDDALFQFSPQKNVLVVLLDGMQSDVFEEVAQGRALDGFTFYPDTAGVSTTTYLAMPTIHSGNVYDGQKPLREAYEEWVVEGSFLTQLAGSGYRSSMINAVMGKCPSGIAECYSAGAVVGGPEQQRLSEAAHLLDISLLRIVPAIFRGEVYNDGKWLVAQYVQAPGAEHFAVEGNAVLRLFADTLSDDSNQPTAKFLHLFNTHLPVVLNDDCAYVGETIAFNRDTFKVQVSCAIDRLEALFASMKSAGVYENTAIVVLADHGTTGLGSAKSEGVGEISTNLIGVANPTLAFKTIGATGGFSVSPDPMSLSDVAGLICNSVKDCSAPERTSERLFNRYSWSAEYWNNDTLPDLVQFAISGPVWEPTAWSRADD